MSDERLERIEQKQDAMQKNQDTMQADIDTMKTDIADLKTGQEDLGRQMRVLHEDTISRIAAVPEYTGPTKQEFDQGLADIKETIGRRLDPLEATVRRLSGS